MEKLTIAIVLQFFLTTIPYAQQHDYMWILGYYGQNPSVNLGGFWINFNDTTPKTIEIATNMDIGDTNSSISDKDGNLLFYTNGIYISDWTHEVMQGGDSLNATGITHLYTETGLAITQGALILPFPDSDSLYYIFHEPVDFDQTGLGYHFPILFYSVVDISQNNGKGLVVSKNQILLQDTLASGKLTACKHANGRDWWILVPEEDVHTHSIYKLLLTPDGVVNLGKQNAGPGITYTAAAVGNAVFTPDGSKYIRQDIRFDPWNAIDIFDFDRCTGELFHLEHFELDDTSFLYGGAAVSPDSRYLYTVTNQVLYQFDLLAPDIEATKTVVGEYDGYIAFWFNSTFGTPQLGPDGKIYVASAVSDTVMHVINTPNQPGLLSHFKQHSINLPNLNDKSIPNFPHYRLGPLDDSPCDTLGLDNHPLAGFAWYAEELAVTFSDNSHYRPETWAWDFGDGGSSDERNPLHTYALPGEYYVCLTVSNEYDSDTYCQWVAVDTMKVVGAGEVFSEMEGFSIYPNPSQDRIILEPVTAFPPGASWCLFDQLGKLVTKQGIPSGARLHTIDLPNLAPGIYFWQLVAKDSSMVKGKLAIVK